jgi:hypothetical protein
MRTPLRPLPDVAERWARRARWLRGLDAVVAWLLLWGAGALALPAADGTALAIAAGGAVVAGALAPGLRAGWRPVSAVVGVAVSRPLRPGDRAWHVGPEGAEAVLVTGRRGLSLVIARPGRGPTEGVTVRRTVVLLVPGDAPPRR